MSVVEGKKLPKWKWLEHCEQGELVRGKFVETTEWAIVANRGNQTFLVVILTGPNAPLWFNTYNTHGMEVMQLECLSYGKDYRIIPDYLALTEESGAGAFTIGENEAYGISLNRPPNDRSAGHLNLKTLTVEGTRNDRFFTLGRWSIWKDGMTAKNEPLKLVQFPPEKSGPQA
jgi:hypothetical protein